MEMDISAIEIDVGIDLSLLVRPPDGNMLPSLIVTVDVHYVQSQVCCKRIERRH